MRVLVVGANGDIGSRVCHRLLDAGVAVRGSVRELDRAPELAGLGVDLVRADLTGPGGLGAALSDVDVVVLTANPIAPRKGDDPAAVVRGLHRTVDDAGRAGVRRVVLTSVPVSPVDDKVALTRSRRALEEHMAASGLESVVLRLPPFMGAWLALVGSSIPLRGRDHATLTRPSPFLQAYRSATGRLVEERGLMLVPGSAGSRHAFIAEDDVATEAAHAALRPDVPTEPVRIGGPEVLSWRDVADVYAELLGRRVRVVATPAAVYAAMATLLRPVGVVPSETMALNRMMAATETAWPAGGGVLAPAEMTTVHDFLAARLAEPATPR